MDMLIPATRLIHQRIRNRIVVESLLFLPKLNRLFIFTLPKTPAPLRRENGLGVLRARCAVYDAGAPPSPRSRRREARRFHTLERFGVFGNRKIDTSYRKLPCHAQSDPSASEVAQSVGSGWEPPHRASIVQMPASVPFRDDLDAGTTF